MSIRLLYESDEWSTYALRNRIQEQGISCRLACMEDDLVPEQFLNCDLVVSRVFASAQFRGHEKSLRQMPRLIAYLREHQIPMLNPYQAHFYCMITGFRRRRCTAPFAKRKAVLWRRLSVSCIQA